MEVGKVCLALGADEFECTHNLGIIFSKGEAAINVLSIESGDDNVFSYFNKILIVTAFGADDPVTWAGKVLGLQMIRLLQL